MAYGTPSDPVAGTVITVAFAVSNILDPIRWLRLLTGNADPPGSNYVVVSTSTTGTSWQLIPTDAIANGAVTAAKLATGAAASNVGTGGVTAAMLASGAAVSNLGYTPLNKAGDTASAELTAPSFRINSGASFWQWIASGATATIGIPTLINVIEMTSAGIVFNGTAKVGAADIITTANDGTLCNAATAAVATNATDSDALDGFTWKQGLTGEFSGTQALTTSFADVAGASFTANRNGQWLVFARSENVMAIGDSHPSIEIVSGGASQEEGVGNAASGSSMSAEATVFAFVTISGSTTVKVRVKKNANAATSNCLYAKIGGIWVAP